MKEATFTLINEFGLAEREAPRFVEVANKFVSTLVITVDGDGTKATGRDVMGLMLLAAKRGSQLKINATGLDEEQAVEALGQLIRSEFGLFGPGWRAAQQNELHRLGKQIGQESDKKPGVDQAEMNRKHQELNQAIHASMKKGFMVPKEDKMPAWATFLSVFGATIVGIILAVNLLGGIVATIWLLVKGHWGIVLKGFLLSMMMPWGFMIVGLPGMLFGYLVIRTQERSRILSIFFGVLTCGYNLTLIQVWVLYVFILAASWAEGGVSAIAMAFWAYSVTLSPLVYMARGESPDSHATTLALFSAQISSVLFLILWAMGFQIAILPLSILIALAGTGFQVYLLNATMDAEKAAKGNF